MRYKSVDEINNFSFRDCELIEFEVNPEGIKLQVEALIVLPDNSQNSNFTESYAGTTEIRLVGGSITSAVKDGYKYYNADDVLIKEVPDTPLTDTEIISVLKNIKSAYLYKVEKNSNSYTLSIEFSDEDDYNTALDSYTLKIQADKDIVEWDIYMNRVQNNY
ncbi:MAG: hypothetical protein E7254_12830 [Lachnospiraceae bacterium]|nr:hypothetical protein [Lachnospiraceae bacterium]